LTAADNGEADLLLDVPVLDRILLWKKKKLPKFKTSHYGYYPTRTLRRRYNGKKAIELDDLEGLDGRKSQS